MDQGTLPANRDSSDYNDILDQYDLVSGKEVQWTAVDIEGGWIFTGITMGFQVWDARGAAAARPVRNAQVIGAFNPSPFPVWPDDGHETQVVRDVDAPPGNSDVLAVAVASGTGGLAVFDTSNKGRPEPLYGDRNKFGRQVYAGRVNDRDYAFLATAGSGLLAYDLTAAAARNSKCVEETPGQKGCGVYVRRIGSRVSLGYVDGVSNADGTKMWIAASSGVPKGVEIWDVSSPKAPQFRIDGLQDENVQAIALWRQSTSIYLAIRTLLGQVRIFDVSCLEDGSCSGLGQSIWTAETSSARGEYLLTYSYGEGRDFLYLGAVTKCAGGEQAEWLYDVTDPYAPSELTPPPAMVNGQLTGYWGWYYRYNPTGFNNVGPRAGKFNGQYFYRAAFSIFDIHQLVAPVPPTAAFSHSPDPAYAGQPVSFVDASSRSPFQWAWAFEDGSPPASSVQNPSVVFASDGEKLVTLMATNDVGPSAPVSKAVSVLDPAPAVGSITVTPPAPRVCQPVTFDVTGATGRPPLAIDWEVRNDSGSPVDGGSGERFIWQTEGTAPGSYSAAVGVDNAYGPPAGTETSFSLASLPPLPANDSFEPTHSPPIAGSTSLSVDVPAATEFCWDFGDGTQFPAGCLNYPSRWSKDPVDGPSPSHAYSGLGTYWVTVQVRNCLETTARTSAAHEVEILSTEPLSAKFEATGGVCFGGAGCFVEAGQLITFNDSTTGAPSVYEYDWDGDGTFEQSSATPVTQHVFGRAGIFTPILNVRRGGETNSYSHTPSPFFVNGLFDDSFEAGNLSKWSLVAP